MYLRTFPGAWVPIRRLGGAVSHAFWVSGLEEWAEALDKLGPEFTLNRKPTASTQAFKKSAEKTSRVCGKVTKQTGYDDKSTLILRDIAGF